MQLQELSGIRTVRLDTTSSGTSIIDHSNQNLNSEADAFNGGLFTFSANDVDLSDALKTFAASQDLSAVVSPAIQGKISGQFSGIRPHDFLKSLASSYGITWYKENAVIYFYATDEITSQMIGLDQLSPAAAISLTRQLNIYQERFPIQSLDNPPMLYVTGPPRYVEGIRSVVQMAEQRMQQQLVRREEVRVFKLNHAWATDVRLPLRDKEQIIPGIATTLQRLMNQQYQSSQLPSMTVLGPSRGSGILKSPRILREEPTSGGTYNDPLSFDGSLSVAPEPIDAPPVPPVPTGLSPAEIQAQYDPDIIPSIEADTRQNAIIVRDSAERMPLYEDMIRQLDVPTQLVEIQACICDINSDVACETGVRALIGYESDSTSLNFGVDTINNRNGVGNIDIAQEMGNLLASGVVLKDHFRFLGLVRALEAQGQARIYSRPSLVTFANLEAELRDDQTYNVRVAGERDAELFSVTAGVQLSVTPYVIPDPAGGDPRIQMTVRIEDGGFDTATVDELPLVRTSSINTQAIINQNESLLVGGYLRSMETSRERSVPGLSRLPGVGRVFRGTSNETSSMQRMFVLTPRIIELSYSKGSKNLIEAPAPVLEVQPYEK